jgi:hypothetical protein
MTVLCVGGFIGKQERDENGYIFIACSVTAAEQPQSIFGSAN